MEITQRQRRSQYRGWNQVDVWESLKLFTACLEDVFEKLNMETKGIYINGEYANNPRFADDIILN